MRIIEITNNNKNDQIIRFRLYEGTLELLEIYQNPSQELLIEFSERVKENDELYMEAIVKEQDTKEIVVLIHYTLGRNHIGSINNIIPVKKDPKKISYTAQYAEKGFAANLGTTTLLWIKREIINDSKNRGYEIKQIVSNNRHTGARAKSAHDSSNEINPNVFVKLREYFLIYDNNEIVIKEKINYF